METVLDLSAAKLYRASAELLRGHPLISVLTPVEVVGSDGKRLGWASLRRSRAGVIADILLCYSTPERLSLETGEKFYARIRGIGSTNTEPFEVVGLLDLSGNGPSGAAQAPYFYEVQILSLELNRSPGYPGQPSLDEGVMI